MTIPSVVVVSACRYTTSMPAVLSRWTGFDVRSGTKTKRPRQYLELVLYEILIVRYWRFQVAKCAERISTWFISNHSDMDVAHSSDRDPDRRHGRHP